MTILIFGDIMGRVGRRALASVIPDLKKKYAPDLIIANGENLAHGKGMTEKTVEEVFASGVDLLTGGNHSFEKDGEKILDDARGLNRGDPQKDPLKVRWLETSISLGREKLERDHNGIVSIQATAQNIIGLMEKVNSMKKNNPNTVFQLKSKLLYVEAEKYAGSLVKILTDLLSTEKKYETERLRFWSDFEEAIKYYRGLEKMSLKEARRRSFMH